MSTWASRIRSASRRRSPRAPIASSPDRNASPQRKEAACLPTTPPPNSPDGTPNPEYGAASKPRFDRWIIDACTRPLDQDWLNYQHEIGLRHTSAKKTKTDNADSLNHIPMRYVLAFSAVVIARAREYLAATGAPPNRSTGCTRRSRSRSCCREPSNLPPAAGASTSEHRAFLKRAEDCGALASTRPAVLLQLVGGPERKLELGHPGGRRDRVREWGSERGPHDLLGSDLGTRARSTPWRTTASS